MPRADRGRRRLRAALFAMAAAALGLAVLRALVVTGEAGGRVLGFVSPAMSLALSLGAALKSVAARPALAWSVALSLAVAGVALLASRMPPAQRIPRPVGAAFCFLAGMVLFSRTPWVAGALALAGGIALTRWTKDRPPEDREPPYLFSIVLASAAGFVLRFWDLTTMASGFAGHVIHHHLNMALPYFERAAGEIAASPLLGSLRVLTTTFGPEKIPLNRVTSAVSYVVFGIGLTPARVTSALLGTLTILAAARFGRVVAGPRLGMVFAFLLAFSPWHVTISRYGDSEHVWGPLQCLLVLSFVLEAFRRGRFRDYVLGAIVLGLGWTVYAANQALFLIVPAFALYKLVSVPHLARRDRWKIATAVAVCAWMSFAPLRSIARAGQVAPNFRTGYLEESLTELARPGRAARMLALAGQNLFFDVDDVLFAKPHGGGGVSTAEAVLFLPGLALCVRWLFLKTRRDAAALVFIALPLLFIPGILGPDPAFRRFLLVALMVMLLAALVVEEWAACALDAGMPKITIGIVAGVACAATFAVAAHDYFRDVWVDTEDSSRNTHEIARIVRTSLGKEPVIVVLPTSDGEVDPDDEVDQYIRFAAHDKLAVLAAQGKRTEDLYKLVSCETFLSHLNEVPLRPGGVTRILIHRDVLGDPAQWCEGRDIAAALAKRTPNAVAVPVKSARGDVVLTSWAIE